MLEWLAIFALDSEYRCRLAIFPSKTNNNKSSDLRGFDVSSNAAGDIIVAGFGRDKQKGLPNNL